MIIWSVLQFEKENWSEIFPRNSQFVEWYASIISLKAENIGFDVPVLLIGKF